MQAESFKRVLFHFTGSSARQRKDTLFLTLLEPIESFVAVFLTHDSSVMLFALVNAASSSEEENVLVWCDKALLCFFSLLSHCMTSCATTTAAGHMQIKMNLADKFSTLERSQSKPSFMYETGNNGVPSCA